MLKAQDLRIGNWIKLSSDEIVEVTAVVFPKLDNLIFHNLLRPIPLTPELLEQCGFNNATENILFEPIYKKKFIELFIVLGNANQYTICICGKFIPQVVQYLHQLQNLYFALTGKELEIKQPATA